MSPGSHSPEFSPAEWARAKSILVRALSLPPAQRAEFLRAACSDDPALLEQVSSLLRAEAQAPPFLRRPETAMSELIASPMPPLVAPAPGQAVGSCRLLSLLGEGATGLVYLAEQARPRRLVAVKILRPGQSSPTALRRLEREAEIMARMRHPGIAQVVESGLSDAGPYVVMEYVEGEPVTRYAREHSLGIEDRLHLFLRICDAAQHAHSMGVIHRDLKPANILVTPSGQPKILDFGVARAADFDHRHTLSDSLGQLIGTLAYMSPEQAAGDIDAVDTRADVYALGCILHELLAGRPPLDILGKPLHEVLRIIQSDAPPRLGAISRGCRGDLETIVAKALDKSREHRYSSVSELAADVRRHLDRMPILARPPSTLYELRRFAQRRRPLVAGIGIAIAGLVGALAWSLVSRDRAHQDFLIARSVAGSWLADVMKALETTPGTFDARRHMIEQLRGPLERFAERYPNDLEAQANLAGLRFATADLDAGSGHYPAALENYSDAFRVLTPIAGSRTAGVEWRLRQSVAAVRIGDILKARDQSDDALGWYYAALAIDHAAAAKFPDNYTARDQLVWSYDRIANISLDSGNVGDGRRFAELMESAATGLLADCPENPKAMWCRIGAHRTMAHLLTVTGDPKHAELERLRALEIGRTLIAIDPNRGYVIGQIYALTERAAHDLSNEDIPGAQPLLDGEARPLVQRMLSLDRHDPIVRDAAFTFYTVLRRLHLARADADGARDAMNGVLDQARALARLDPGSIVAAMRVASVELENAQLLADLGLVEDAVEAVCALRDELLRTTAQFPGCPEPYTLLMRVAQAPPSPALADAVLALVAADRAAAFSSPPDPAPLVDLAELLVQQDNPAAATAVLQRAASLEGQLAADRRPWLQSQVVRLQDAVNARR